MMWAFIFIFMFAAFIAACIYLITRVRKFAWVGRLANDRKWLSILISALTCVVFIVVLSLAMGYINAISDWAIKFKTGCRSEYVIMDIHGK